VYDAEPLPCGDPSHQMMIDDVGRIRRGTGKLNGTELDPYERVVCGATGGVSP
jgi:hypothetical protein